VPMRTATRRPRIAYGQVRQLTLARASQSRHAHAMFFNALSCGISLVAEEFAYTGAERLSKQDSPVTSKRATQSASFFTTVYSSLWLSTPRLTPILRSAVAGCD
jgi:hypothetical protein